MTKAATDPGARLTSFYADLSSLDAILGLLSQAGVDVSRLTARDLYTRNADCQNLGAFAVLEAIARAVEEYGAAKAGARVLDVGSGLGGPARYLADRHGANVTGVDLLPLRVEIAEALSQRTGMSGRTSFQVADATALPFSDGAFSEVWMLDASIHVREKSKLFAELARVLAKGGLLVLHDMPGPLPRSMAVVRRRAPYFAPRLSRLVRHLEDVGLRLLAWRETTALVLADFEQKRAALEQAQAGLPSNLPAPARRRLTQGGQLLEGYLGALGRDGAVCGFLIARRSLRENPTNPDRGRAGPAPTSRRSTNLA
jgi:SAM-dependent methyltransferase